MNDTNRTYRLGRKDGAEIARETGCAIAPEHGWDGNALAEHGFDGLVRYFRLPASTRHESPVFAAHMVAYHTGCQAGADAQIEVQVATRDEA
jgi:hypothetical protein